MDIVKVIQETATWLEKVNKDYENNLYRTPELIPTHHYCDIPNNEKMDFVDDIVTKRSKLLASQNVVLIPVNELGDYGRVMLFNPGQAIWDGAAEDASCYYVDYTDSPPFDTWIATIKQLNAIGFYSHGGDITYEHILIAWVPKSQYFYADEAIQVSMLGLYEWPEDENISDEFSELKAVFKRPEEIIKSAEPIDFQKRIRILNDIITELDKNSPPFKGSIIWCG